MSRGAEVCIGPGPGLAAQVMLRLGPGSNDSNHTLYSTFRAFSGHRSITRKKLFAVAVIFAFIALPGPGNESHRPYFLVDFRSCSFLQTVGDNTLQASQQIYLTHPQTPK
jgi:hypothetical protein